MVRVNFDKDPSSLQQELVEMDQDNRIWKRAIFLPVQERRLFPHPPAPLPEEEG